MKTVDKPVAPSLPGTSAYKQQILKEQKLGPLPADDPRLQPYTKPHESGHANLMPASSPPKGALDGPVDVTAIEDWTPPVIDEEPLDHEELERRRKLALIYAAEAEEGAWRPPYITSNTAPNQSCPVWKSTSASGAPDNSSLSHFSAMARPSWLGQAARNEHHHAIEQASRRWRGGRRNDSARTRRKILIPTQTVTVVAKTKNHPL